MISDYEDIAEFILKNYNNKVVEVGVGSMPHVALALKDRLEVIVTDINVPFIKEQDYAGIRFCRDDIFAPEMSVYVKATLIYSIRPPIDMQAAIAKVAKEVGADMLIRPFGNEKADLENICKKFTLMNYRKARFYIYRF